MVLEPSHRRVRQRTGGRDTGVLERVWDIWRAVEHAEGAEWRGRNALAGVAGCEQM